MGHPPMGLALTGEQVRRAGIGMMKLATIVGIKTAISCLVARAPILRVLNDVIVLAIQGLVPVLTSSRCKMR
jgi:hypothetical protein